MARKNSRVSGIVMIAVEMRDAATEGESVVLESTSSTAVLAVV